jgi:hypothetical protein
MESTDPIFMTVIIHLQEIGDLFAASAITQHDDVCRMMKLEELHA